ncbi:hypothetical protein [Actinoplanes sp. NPDC026619]|uniref:hypothetical protein n=1 Tax=Actinoplanes sp. NPDC026619 TaxID=3155798 RepID=UPI0033E7BB70
MPGAVKTAVTRGVADARTAAHGGTVKVSSLRKLVRRDSAAVNAREGAAIVKVTTISQGVQVSATNPWTKKTISYVVKASGRKIIVKKS